MDGSHEYIEYALADSRQGVVLQFGGCAWCSKLLTVKTCHVKKYSHRKPRTWTDTLVKPKSRRGVCRVLVGKLEGKKTFGRPRHRLDDNIKMDLREVGCGWMDFIDLRQDRERWRAVVNAIMNLRVP
jgi:hypothetical protein